MKTCGSGEKECMQTSLHRQDLTLVLQEGQARTDGLLTFTRVKCAYSKCWNVKRVTSTHHLGEEPVLDCLHVFPYQTHLKTTNKAVWTSERSSRRVDRWDGEGSRNLRCQDGWTHEVWSRFRFGRSDLGHEQGLLIVQAGTHVTLQGFLQGLISGRHSERSCLALYTHQPQQCAWHFIITLIGSPLLFLPMVGGERHTLLFPVGLREDRPQTMILETWESSQNRIWEGKSVDQRRWYTVRSFSMVFSRPSSCSSLSISPKRTSKTFSSLSVLHRFQVIAVKELKKHQSNKHSVLKNIKSLCLYQSKVNIFRKT